MLREELFDSSGSDRTQTWHRRPPPSATRNCQCQRGKGVNAVARQRSHRPWRQPPLDFVIDPRRRHGELPEIIDGVKHRAQSISTLGRRMLEQRRQIVAMPRPRHRHQATSNGAKHRS